MKQKRKQSQSSQEVRAAEFADRCRESALRAGMKKSAVKRILKDVHRNPSYYAGHPQFGELAELLASEMLNAGGDPMKEGHGNSRRSKDRKVPYAVFGDDIDAKALEQMSNAARLPVAVAGALMPDAHVGYGLPIGGVLAVRNAVIPYAVGADIACRMHLSVLDLPQEGLVEDRRLLAEALESETNFGVGASFRIPREHPVLDEDWSVSPVTSRLRSKAREQLGTSGSGNHFVEFGLLEVNAAGAAELGVREGRYVGFMSHSGSRGVGVKVASHYSRLAMKLRRNLPKGQHHLAWLDIGSPEGLEYWAAMELMGRYSAANHELIHARVLSRLGLKALAVVDNPHNFAWKEELNGREVIVHRKGATPAHRGMLGVIPGSMGTPGFVVRGKGNPLSLNSAAHGAGRSMGRKEAKTRLNRSETRRYLEQRGVTLLSGGLDESPFAYKDVAEVMAAQAELVDVLARFDPKLVKMAD